MDHGDMVVVNASLRTACGTGSSRALRSAGLLPAVVYGGNRDPISVSLSYGDFLKKCRTVSIFSKLIELHIDGHKEYVLTKSVQKHPVSGALLHVDFQFVDKAGIKIEVPVVFKNEQKCLGVKRGGVLNVLHRSLLVLCSPDHIPSHFEVDLTDLGVGHSLHVSDLKLSKEINVVMKEENPVIVTISGADSGSDEPMASEGSTAE